MTKNRNLNGKQSNTYGNFNSTLRISQCMIVKNEEKNIRQALSWGKGVVFEQIVVDTGSTDRTVELAKEMGAKVYHFEWIDDFSAAKNFAIEKAKGDWIAFLDADEYMTEEWAKKLPALIKKVNQTYCVTIRTPMVSIDENQNITQVARQWRFFRRMPQVRYRNAVHEYLGFEEKGIPNEAVWDTGEEFPIYHTGYIPAVMLEKKKFERNVDILKKELAKNPQDYNVMGYLGDAYRAKEDLEEAEKWFWKSIDAMPEKADDEDERSAMTYIYLLTILVDKKEEEAKVMALYEKAKEYMPWVYDFDFVAAVYFYRRQEYGKALRYFEQALEVVERYEKKSYGVFMEAMISEVWEYMAVCYYETGNLAACVKQCVSLLKEDKQRMNTLATLLCALRDEKPDAVLHFLNSLYDLNDIKDRIFIMKAAIQAQAAGFLQVFKMICTPEEQTVIQQALSKFEEVATAIPLALDGGLR